MDTFLIITYILILSITVCNANEDLPTNYIEYESQIVQQTRLLGECPQTSFWFPFGNVTDYIRVKRPFDDLTEFTICMHAVAPSERLSLLAYATLQYNYTITIYISLTSLSMDINNQQESIDASFTPGHEYHLCFASFITTTGRTYVFIDGELMHILHHEPQALVPGNGKMIIGQTAVMLATHGFSKCCSYQGKISNLMMWDVVLSVDDIYAMSQNPCVCPDGQIGVLDYNNIQLHGSVLAFVPPSC